MDDQTSEIFGTGEKWLSDPQEVTGTLLIERTIWMYAGMDKKSSPVVVEEGQRADPVKVRNGKIGCARGSVAAKRRFSAI